MTDRKKKLGGVPIPHFIKNIIKSNKKWHNNYFKTNKPKSTETTVNHQYKKFFYMQYSTPLYKKKKNTEQFYSTCRNS